MTVKEFKEELEHYDDDAMIAFVVCEDFVPDSITVDMFGNKSVHLDTEVKPTFIGNVHGDMCVELGCN